jgi:hypothetical protein
LATPKHIRLIDILNEMYHEANESSGHIALQLAPVRGMTPSHLKQISDWMTQSGIGRLEPTVMPDRVLFVPSTPIDPEADIDPHIEHLFDQLHKRFRMKPFHRNNVAIKTV